MCLYYLIAGYAGLALKAVNVLGEQLEQKPLLMQQSYERVCYCRPELSGVQFLSEGVEGLGVVAEEANVEDGLGIGQIETREVGVEPRVWRSEVWYTC